MPRSAGFTRMNWWRRISSTKTFTGSRQAPPSTSSTPAKGQRLQIISAIDTSESFSFDGTFHAFFIGGGLYPTSIHAGFDPITLVAYNVTAEGVTEVIGMPTGGPIIYIGGRAPERICELASIMHRKIRWAENEDEEDESRTWSWRKLLNSVEGGDVRAPNLIVSSPAMVLAIVIAAMSRLASLLLKILRANKLENAQQVFEEISNASFTPNSVSYNILADGWCRRKHTRRLFRVAHMSSLLR